MKKVITPFLKYAIDKAKRNKHVQNLFESPFELDKFPKMGEFTDSQGNNYVLRDGLRTKIKPGWERLVRSAKPNLTKGYFAQQRQNGLIAAEKILPLVESFGQTFKNRSVLEIGCDVGSTSFAIAEAGASKVVGTEFAGYKVDSVKEDDLKRDEQLVEVTSDLKNIRSQIASEFDRSDEVNFVDDDISYSKLDHNSFDIICSWQVLEHVHDTEKAFASIYNLLKEGGVTVHEYNPFFCINGGHSLCTLDFLWGHVRLSDDDFEKYLDEIRPQEKEKAMSFFHQGLNRTTLNDLKLQLQKAGFTKFLIIPFPKEQHLRMIDEEILSQAQNQYPDVTMMDLAAPRVYVVAKK